MRAGWGMAFGLLLLLIACTPTTQQQPSDVQPANLLTMVAIEQPVDMQTVKTDSCFVWMSNGDAHRLRNLCIYSYSGEHLDAMELLRKRDSVMHRNVKGATDSIYQQTVLMSVSSALTTTDHVERLQMSGLWQMKGDAMGGPFFCCAVRDSVRHRIVVADAFVYAPGKNKRELMDRLKKIVRTINIKHNNNE